MLALVGFVVDKHPESHPHESQHTDDDESHFPSESLGKGRNAHRCGQSAHRGAGVEDRGGESAVFLGEVLSGHLDGGGEVSALTQGKDGPAEEEKIHRDGGDTEGSHGAGLNSLESGHAVDAFIFHGHPSASGMEAGTQRPHEDGPEIAFLGTHPVDELAGKEAEHGIKDGEHGGDGTVIVVSPVEFGRNKVLPRQREYLAVHIVDRRGKEEHRTNHPTIVGHFRSLYRAHKCVNRFVLFVIILFLVVLMPQVFRHLVQRYIYFFVFTSI